MQTNVASAKMVLTAQGGTDGYLTGASNTGFYPGAVAWIVKADTTLPQRLLITNLSGATKVGVRFVPQDTTDPKLATGAVKHPYYGRTDSSAYDIGSTLTMESQLVPTDPAFIGLSSASG